VRSAGFTLLEVLLSIIVLAVMAVGFTHMVTHGRQLSEFNARYVEAAYLARKVVDALCREALWNFEGLPSDGDFRPLVAAEDGERSRFFASLDVSSEAARRLHPRLHEHLDDFRVKATVEPFSSTMTSVKQVRVTVQYRLTKGDAQWHGVELATLVVRRTAL